MEKGKINITSIICIVLFLVIVAGASFAYFGTFSQNISDKAAVNVQTGQGLNSSFVSSSTPLELHATLANMISASAGDVIADSNSNLNVSLIMGSNVSNYSCKYDIIFEYDLDSKIYGTGDTPVTDENQNELTLKVTGENVGTNNYSTELNFSYDTNWTAKTTTEGAKRVIVKDAVISDNIGTGTTQTWNINLKFYLLSASQASLQGQTFTGYFYIDNIRCGS